VGGDLKVDVPPIGILNAKSLQPETTYGELHAIEPTSGRILLRWNCMYSAVLNEPNLTFEKSLYPYPYDHHTLQIVIDVRFGPFRKVPLALATNDDLVNRRVSATGCPHAVIEDHVALPEFVVAPDLMMAQRQTSLTAAMFIWRKHHQTETNILQLNALMTVMSFFAFVYPPEKLNERLSLAVGLLFAVVGLRVSVDALLPKVDFLTLTQRQLNLSIYVIFVVVADSVALAAATRLLFGAETFTYAHVFDGITCAATLCVLIWSYAEVYRCRDVHLRSKPRTLQGAMSMM
jgi:hypothetical protein